MEVYLQSRFELWLERERNFKEMLSITSHIVYQNSKKRIRQLIRFPFMSNIFRRDGILLTLGIYITS